MILRFVVGPVHPTHPIYERTRYGIDFMILR
jgi:hypothetical protein